MQDIDLVTDSKQSFAERRKKRLEDKKRKRANKYHLTATNTPSEIDLARLFQLYQAGDLDAAINLGVSISNKFPNHPYSWKVLGAVYGRVGNVSESITSNKKSVSLSPQDSEAHNLLGISLYDAKKFADAEASFRNAIALRSEFAKAHSNLGLTLKEMDRLTDAEISCRNATTLKSSYAEGHLNLGLVLHSLEKFVEAEDSFRCAISLQPKLALAYSNLGLTLFEMNRLRDAEMSCRHALMLELDNAQAHNNLAIILQQLRRFDEAEESYRQAIKFKPDFDQGYSNLAKMFATCGNHKEAQVSFKQAIAINPEDDTTHSHRNFFLNYTTDNSPQEIYQIHMDFEKQFGGLDRRTPLNLPDFMSAKKPLRVGYVSGDLRNHSVAYFLLPILEKHNSEHVEIFCYYNNNVNNQMTDRLRSASDHWRSVYKVSDEDTVELIKNDNIDILVDLSGHSDKNRLLVFAQKPAPIQVTWLGYPNTTGLSAIDYRLTDLVADPVGIADDLHSEELMRLPDGFLCYKGDLTVPPSKVLPSKKNGFTTFGSFNNFSKMSPQVIKVWADILHKVPNSKLILKSSNEVFDEKDYLKLFLEEGISKNRVEIYGRLANYQDHLNLYNLIDICLDTFPYNGATTTCEALWMGVPVIALLGDRHVGRVGASILNSAGLKDFVAEDSDAYIDLATEYAGNEDYLENLRLSLRQKIQSSSLCDADTAARSLETAYKEMWNRYVKESV